MAVAAASRLSTSCDKLLCAQLDLPQNPACGTISCSTKADVVVTDKLHLLQGQSCTSAVSCSNRATAQVDLCCRNRPDAGSDLCDAASHGHMLQQQSSCACCHHAYAGICGSEQAALLVANNRITA